jgi:hypothetical protein
LPAAHFAQEAPPQSMSLSAPFLTRSVQFGAWQRAGVPLHTPLWQSAATAQSLPLMHLEHTTPPQSMSVSSWFLTTSVQLGSWQM